MASVGHVAMGMAAARLYRPARPPRWRSMARWSVLSLLPDVDVIGFSLGVQYGDPWGHRGATHSLTFAIAVALALGLAAYRLNRPVVRTALVAAAVLVSHPLFDTMTDGGLGCALLWPFDLTRYFAPWRPIPVAPIGLAFLSPMSSFIVLTELVLFSPLLVFALRSRRGALRHRVTAVLFALSCASVWLVASSDPTREAVVGLVVREKTVYASGFSERAFRAVKPGDLAVDVRRQLGVPLGENWIYSPRGQPFQPAATRSASGSSECLTVRFEAQLVITATDPAACSQLGVRSGMSDDDVVRLLGSPAEACWRYTGNFGNGHYRLRMVCFQHGRVDTALSRWEATVP